MPKLPLIPFSFISADVHSHGELGVISRFNQFKDSLLLPLTSLLQLAHIKPVYLSLASVIILLLTLTLSLLLNQPFCFLLGLLAHLILDGLDGPLARRQKATTYGALADVTADHIGIITTSLFISYFNYAPSPLAIIYTLLYTTVITLAIIRNAFKIPYQFLFRPRLYIYLALAIDYFFNFWLTGPALLLSSFLLLLPAITGTTSLLRYKIYQRLN